MTCLHYPMYYILYILCQSTDRTYLLQGDLLQLTVLKPYTVQIPYYYEIFNSEECKALNISSFCVCVCIFLFQILVKKEKKKKKKGAVLGCCKRAPLSFSYLYCPCKRAPLSFSYFYCPCKRRPCHFNISIVHGCCKRAPLQF